MYSCFFPNVSLAVFLFPDPFTFFKDRCGKEIHERKAPFRPGLSVSHLSAFWYLEREGPENSEDKSLTIGWALIIRDRKRLKRSNVCTKSPKRTYEPPLHTLFRFIQVIKDF